MHENKRNLNPSRLYGRRPLYTYLQIWFLVYNYDIYAYINRISRFTRSSPNKARKIIFSEAGIWYSIWVRKYVQHIWKNKNVTVLKDYMRNNDF